MSKNRSVAVGLFQGCYQSKVLVIFTELENSEKMDNNLVKI